MNRRIKLIAVCLVGAVVLALGLLAAGCGGDDDSGAASTAGGAAVDGTAVKIADKGFTESQIVAQLYAQALEARLPAGEASWSAGRSSRRRDER